VVLMLARLSGTSLVLVLTYLVLKSTKRGGRGRRKRSEREREKVVWDGHTASKANTLDKFSTNVNFDEQIAATHRSKGLRPWLLPCCEALLHRGSALAGGSPGGEGV